MLFGELLNEERCEGRAEGQTNILALIAAMTKDGRAAEVPRLSEDADFLKAMLEAYHIEA